MHSIYVFLDITKFADFQWKILMSAILWGCVTWFIYFLDIFYVRYNYAKFHHCRICVKDFREEGFLPLPPPIREQPRKCPSWIGQIFFRLSSKSVFSTKSSISSLVTNFSCASLVAKLSAVNLLSSFEVIYLLWSWTSMFFFNFRNFCIIVSFFQ